MIDISLIEVNHAHLSQPGVQHQEPAMTAPAPDNTDFPDPHWDSSAVEESIPAVGTVGGVRGGGSVDSPFPWQELHALPARRLQQLCNQTFVALDVFSPPAEIAAQYAALVDELEDRETLARQQKPSSGKGATRREPTVAFRDNAVARRFEVFVGGDLAGYVKYRMSGGQVTLLETVITSEFFLLGNEIEATLFHRTFLSAHQRRLAIGTRCARVRAFLTAHPQYRYLVPTTAQATIPRRVNTPASSNTLSSSTA